MGKQINYYMEYESFLKIAEKSLSMGLIIIKEEDNRIIQSKTISSITKDCIFYHFYMPSIGSLKINDYGTHQAICSTGIYGNALIEAGFSHINHDGKSVVRNRIYVQSGYYDENGEWKERS